MELKELLLSNQTFTDSTQQLRDQYRQVWNELKVSLQELLWDRQNMGRELTERGTAAERANHLQPKGTAQGPEPANNNPPSPPTAPFTLNNSPPPPP